MARLLYLPARKISVPVERDAEPRLPGLDRARHIEELAKRMHAAETRATLFRPYARHDLYHSEVDRTMYRLWESASARTREQALTRAMRSPLCKRQSELNRMTLITEVFG